MSDTIKVQYTPEEETLLSRYVTNTTGPIFAVTNLPGIVGAVFARYSRAQGDFREILLKEFIKEGNLDPKKADDLIERVLIAFGDDSVGELENCPLSLTLSILASKEIEDRRIGGSPIEKSTRYVFFHLKDADGNYPYVVPPEIQGTEYESYYRSAMDFAFDTYASLIDPLQEYYRTLKPIESAEYDIDNDGVKEQWQNLSSDEDRKKFRITYNADVRTKACDTLRAILPLSTRTNVGVSGNGRFFQWTISHCLGSQYAEVREIGQVTLTELSKIIPKYVKRAAANQYTLETNSGLKALAKELFAHITPKMPTVADTSEVVLMSRGEEMIAKKLQDLVSNYGADKITDTAIKIALDAEEDLLIMSSALFPYLQHSLSQIRDELRKMSIETHERIKSALVGKRSARRDRPGRSLEASYPFTYDMLTDFGTYKDLQRHRMATQLRQPFTPILGFAMPKDIVAIGMENKILEVVRRIQDLYNSLADEMPDVASYATLHGSLVRWVIGLNDRALMHLVELRSTPQGHPSYRKVAQKMHECVNDRSGWRADAMQFVDHNDYDGWARGDSEAKQRAKEAALEKGK